MWSDSIFKDHGDIYHVTYDIYDELIEERTLENGQGWLIFFIRGRFQESMTDINKQLFRLIWHAKHNINAPDYLKVGFVDIIDEGELLKETFDIYEVPSVRYVFGGKFHTLKWK